MTYSKLNILVYLALSLMLLFAPFSLEIFPGGETYAMARWFSHDQNNSDSSGQVVIPSAGGQGTSPQAHPTPEPATLLLFGAGAVSLAALRRKFRKK